MAGLGPDHSPFRERILRSIWTPDQVGGGVRDRQIRGLGMPSPYRCLRRHATHSFRGGGSGVLVEAEPDDDDFTKGDPQEDGYKAIPESG